MHRGHFLVQKGRDTLPSGIGMIGLITCWIGVHGVVGIRFVMNEPEEMRDKRPGIWYHGWDKPPKG